MDKDKLGTLDDLLRALREEGKRVLIFAEGHIDGRAIGVITQIGNGIIRLFDGKAGGTYVVVSHIAVVQIVSS